MRSKKKEGGAKLSELQNLQTLVVKALTADITEGIEQNDTRHTSIKNSLQLLRDNDVTCTDDTLSEIDKLASLLPPLDTSVSSMTSHRYI